MSAAAKKAVFESAFIPHVGWLRHDPGDEVVSLLRQGYFEGAEQAFFWLFLRPGDTFIDGGAHIGLYSLIAHRVMQGEGRIIAIEPAEDTARHLQANLERNGVVEGRIIRAALWKSTGSIGFVAENQGRTAYARVAFDGTEATHVTVPAVTLSQVIAESGADEATLVKIDVEGAEPEALNGVKQAVAKGAAPLLMVEVAEHNLQRRGLATQDLIGQIEAMGYALFEFEPETRQLKPCPVDGPIWFKNLFACTDAKRVNARLRSAASDRKEIARDILGRAAACARFKELEDLDRFRHLAEISEGNREWAERSERLLAAERDVSAGLRTTIEEMQQRMDANELAAVAKQAEDNRLWAERTEKMLAEQKRIAEDNRAWAERTEKMLAEQKRIAEDNRAWAERTEDLLAGQKRVADDNRAWAERSENLLAEQKRFTDDNRAWAERTEGFLAEQKAISAELAERLSAKERAADEHRAWAEETGVFLAAQKLVAEGLADRLSAEQRSAADNRAWAERTEELLSAQKSIAEDIANRLADKERLAEELRADLARAREEARRLQEEIPPLRLFATRFAWIYRLSKKFGAKS